jgi:putative flippase GtrA
VQIVRQLLRHRLVAELAAFGFVGGLCLATDIILFNVLVFGAGMAAVPAKALTMVVTGTIAFVGHRHVTFRHRRRLGISWEAPLFVAVTGLSLVAGLAPVWLARHVADLDGPVWLNAANLVGIAIGTVLRYMAYRHIVWSDSDVPVAESEAATSEAATPVAGPARSAR